MKFAKEAVQTGVDCCAIFDIDIYLQRDGPRGPSLMLMRLNVPSEPPMQNNNHSLTAWGSGLQPHSPVAFVVESNGDLNRHGKKRGAFMARPEEAPRKRMG